MIFDFPLYFRWVHIKTMGQHKGKMINWWLMSNDMTHQRAPINVGSWFDSAILIIHNKRFPSETSGPVCSTSTVSLLWADIKKSNVHNLKLESMVYIRGQLYESRSLWTISIWYFPSNRITVCKANTSLNMSHFSKRCPNKCCKKYT